MDDANNSTKKRLATHIARAVAVDASVDTRTVFRAVENLPVRPMAYERIERALRARHLEHLLVHGPKVA